MAKSKIKIVTTEGEFVSTTPHGVGGDKAHFLDMEAAEKDADFRNKKAEQLGLKTRYKVEA